ncbi:restriction endonuclease subunit S [Moraxella bovoculi]|uniref:restriction endonuclease subunit S n=1 Tax=Moraxella bovoculi TaxID=386891 RepID=UPI0009BC2233|nr:restriction endonuclease subunit S [Moraxella bovoculi]AXR98996.1 restriction endonuclease subunit S [Moraxella bovoculi]
MTQPKLRFAQFDGDWEIKEFDKITERVSKASVKSDLPRIEYEDVISGSGVLNKDVYQKNNVKKGTQFEAGDILFGKLRPYLQNWLFPSFQGVAVGDWWVLRPKGVQGCYLYYLIQGDAFQTVANLSAGSKMPRSDWKIVSKTKFYTPPTEQEQTTIGNFFRQIDELITLRQRELEHTKELKKGLLQKMFPKNGETVPQIRFPQFTDAWERCRLGELFIQTSNYVNPKLDDIELWSLTVEQGLTPKTERYTRDFLVKKENSFKAVYPNEFVYNPMNITLGAVGYNHLGKSVAISGYYITMKTTDKADDFYMATWLKSPQAINLYKNHATGSLIEKQRVQFNTFSKINCTLPTEQEQTTIGNFFRQIDELITLRQRELEHTRQLKRALLQQMFV